MSSEFSEVFDALIDTHEVKLLIAPKQAENLRVSLVRRWSQYKTRMDSLGFLSDELKELGLRMEPLLDTTTGMSGVRFSLVKKRRGITYQIMLPAADTPATGDGNVS